jgi:hypothetical protein
MAFTRKYGRYSKTSSRTYSKNNTNKKTNFPVKTIYKRRVSKTKVDTNKQAIMTLSRQVKNLQLTKLGLYQKSYQKTYINLSPSTNNRGLINRVAFLPLNDFTFGSGFMQSYTDANDEPQYESAGGAFANYEPQSGLFNNRFNYWVNCNDQVSSAAYLPIRCSITMQFELKNMQPNSDPLWIRYMIIKQKKQLLNTTAHALNLPQNMNALSGMARDNRLRNRINKEYFTVVTDKWVKLTNTNDVMKDVHKSCTVSMKFPNKVIKIDKEFPITDRIDPTVSVNQTFISNVSPKDVYYLCIHTSREMDISNSSPEVLYMQANRFMSWRDQHGVSS